MSSELLLSRWWMREGNVMERRRCGVSKVLPFLLNLRSRRVTSCIWGGERNWLTSPSDVHTLPSWSKWTLERPPLVALADTGPKCLGKAIHSGGPGSSCRWCIRGGLCSPPTPFFILNGACWPYAPVCRRNSSLPQSNCIETETEQEQKGLKSENCGLELAHSITRYSERREQPWCSVKAVFFFFLFFTVLFDPVPLQNNFSLAWRRATQMENSGKTVNKT